MTVPYQNSDVFFPTVNQGFHSPQGIYILHLKLTYSTYITSQEAKILPTINFRLISKSLFQEKDTYTSPIDDHQDFTSPNSSPRD